MAKFRPILFSILFLLFTACQNTEEAPNSAPPRVGVYPVEVKEIIPFHSYSGRLVAYNTAEVRPQVGGIILKREFEEGSLVKKGDILYEIDPAPYMADLNKVKATLKSREKTTERYKRLLKTQSVGYQDYEDIFFQWQESIAELAIAELNLEYCTLKAPLDGKIGKSNITMGALVVKDQPQELATIQQLDPIYLDLNPPATEILKLVDPKNELFKNARVKIWLENGDLYPQEGQIKFIDNHVKKDTNTLGLRASFPNESHQLLPGMFVRARIYEDMPKKHTIIPQQALFRDSKGSPQVYVVGSDNIAELRLVELSHSLGNTWVISSGLKDGELLVSEGLLRVRPGMLLDPKKSDHIKLELELKGNEPSDSSSNN